MSTKTRIPGPNSCRYCRHWQGNEPLDDGFTTRSQCRVTSPQNAVLAHDPTTQWPNTEGSQWCGEHSLNLEKFAVDWQYRGQKIIVEYGNTYKVQD